LTFVEKKTQTTLTEQSN